MMKMMMMMMQQQIDYEWMDYRVVSVCMMDSQRTITELKVDMCQLDVCSVCSVCSVWSGS